MIQYGELTTTLGKAKTIKAQAEKLLTKAKRGTLADRRIIHCFLAKSNLVNVLVERIAPLFKDKKGGYLKIVRVGIRKGDGTQMAKLLFTEEIPEVEKVLAVKKEVKKENVKTD